MAKEGRFMKKITLGIDGMMCGMCETHINNCVRTSFNVKSVKSSHLKNETVIIAEDGLNEAELKAAIEKTLSFISVIMARLSTIL